ncbi:MAG: hypothetical protein JNL02_05065 [Saprospiraceae bacterium]|nr:hypothetical protein [Saprospiraceae bacterium]
MKHPFSLLLACALLLALHACTRKMTVNVKFNGEPLPNASISAPATKNKQAYTDSTGNALFTLKKRRLHKDAQLRVEHKPLFLDTIYVLPMRPYVPIVFVDPAIPKLRQKTIKNDILPKIAQADSLLNEIEREIDAYIRLHPDTNVEEYKMAIAFRRDELNMLKQNVKDLYVRYDRVIRDMGDGEVEDFSDAEVEFARAMEQTRRFTNLTRKTYDQSKQVLSCDPDTDFRTDIFFNSGEFEIGALTPAQSQNIRSFYEKISYCLNSPAFRGKKGIRIKLDAHGYTDGIPCGQTTYNRMSAAGECADLYSDNGNLCLSLLRARSIRSEIAELIPPEYTVAGQYWGKGSKLARDSRDNRSSLRKCTLTFSINTDEIMRRHE